MKHGTPILALGVLCMLLGAACGENAYPENSQVDAFEVAESRLAPARENLVPVACGEAEDLPEDAVVVATKDGTLLAEYLEEDPVTRISSAGAKEYSCNCTSGEGTCYPKLVGNTVVCASMSCSECSLEVTGRSRFRAMERATAACGDEYSEENRALVRSRVAQIRQWQRAMRVPSVVYAEGYTEAQAPEGTRLVVELLGTARIVYAAPERLFDRQTGELRSTAGPSNDTGDMILQAAGGGKAKCSCSGSGSCSFTMDGVCAGSCYREGGGDRGCVIKLRGVRRSSEVLEHSELRAPRGR